ncbi:MAG TPA: hypothetical protein VMH86_12970 [Rhizomicrobium sp.]|nr:hypothetical protein [Rhizomicrobium sp.]
MALTVSFKEAIVDRIRRDPAFGQALLREGVDALLSQEFDTAKDMLRDYVNATLGFEELSRLAGIPVKSLMRMLGPRGNPQAGNLLSVVAALQRYAGVQFHVVGRAAGGAERSGPKRATRKTARDIEPDARYGSQAREPGAAFGESGGRFRK